MRKEDKIPVDPFTAISLTLSGMAIMIAALGEALGYFVAISSTLVLFGSIWALFSDRTMTSQKDSR